MTFIDTNVIMYAVGRPHPLQDEARQFFDTAASNGTPLCTSAEVLQELAHVYLPAGRAERFDDAMAVLEEAKAIIWELTEEDVLLARQLHAQHPNLSARDLCHLASCRRRGVSRIMTFDQGFAAAASSWGGTAVG